MSNARPPIQVLPLPSCASEWVEAEVDRQISTPAWSARLRWEPAKNLCQRMHSAHLLTDMLSAARKADVNDPDATRWERARQGAWQTIHNALLTEVAARLDHRAECQNGPASG